MHTYPMLYKRSSTGKDLQWRIWVDGSTIHEEWGQIGGKLQATSDTIREGKNIGRANETTPEEQAIAEAQSKWEKKLKGHNYVESLDAAKSGASSDMVEGGILPILAHKFSEHGDKIKYPCYVDPKLDGHRCLAVIDSKGKCTLWSRTRKAITSLPHIIEAIEGIAKRNNLEGMVLDGELFNWDYRFKFEELTSLIRPKEPKPNHHIVQYWIYDLAIPKVPYSERRKRLNSIYMANPLVLVTNKLVDDEDELMLEFEHLVAAGWEGAMARNVDGLYVNKRSYDLQKIKQFDEDEFEIIGIKEGRGKLEGHGIFECLTTSGEHHVSFEAKMKGDTTKLKDFYQHPERYIGKYLTVQYQGLTKYNKPRFPVALRLRKDI